jgi:hypothetical protein
MKPNKLSRYVDVQAGVFIVRLFRRFYGLIRVVE